MANRLASATSPYLLQHADNPVDWQPWSDAALDEARRRDLPVLLSIGYSTCHWCHVMAHESFEDDELAARLNAAFVPVKVDREERPDVDALYMTAAQALGGGAGWPLTVFLTPDGHPFYAGTYFPPRPVRGMPSLTQVLDAVTDAWTQRRDALESTGTQVADAVREALRVRPPAAPDAADAPSAAGDDPDALELALTRAADRIAAQADRDRGGFGGAPKFPMCSALTFLRRHGERTGRADLLAVVDRTLDAMADGGIHDQLGGGFSRYAVDADWRVPHFEKMLYDNAQLLELYAERFRATGSTRYAEVARGIVAWLEREMRTGSGAYAAALDADSEGVEGRFYVWTPDRLADALGDEDAQLAARHLGVSADGNLDGASVLRRAATAEELAGPGAGPQETAAMADRLTGLRERLLRARAERVRPHRDDKVVTAWNGLVIGALARAGRVLDEPEWIGIASRVAEAVVATRTRPAPDGGLDVARSATAEGLSADGALEDYAALARGLLALYAADGGTDRLETAQRLVDRALERFRDETGDGWVDAVETGLFARPRDLTDGASPSGNALLADASATLAACAEDDAGRAAVREHVLGVATALGEHALHGGFAWSVVDRLAEPPADLVLDGDRAAREELARAARRAPETLVVARVDDEASARWPLLARRPFPADADGAAFLCADHVCELPLTDPAGLAARLRG